MSFEASGAGDSPAPWHEVDQLCTAARYEFEHGSEGMAAIDAKLDVALAAATPQKDEILNSSGSYRRIVSFAIIADTARTVGAPEGYVRKALNKAVDVFETGKRSSSTPSLDAGALSNIIKIAHETGRGSTYIEPIFDHVREQVMAGSATDSSFVWKFSGLVRDAGHYGLGTDYQLELLEEGRAEAHELADIDGRVDRLAAIARVASVARQDPDYSRGIIEDAHDVVEREAVDTQMQVRHLTELAAVARKTGQDEDYVRQLLRESLGRGFRDLIENGDIVAAHYLRTAVRACVELDQVPASEAFIRRAVGFIGSDIDATPRQRHQMLNGLLWDLELPEDYTAGGQIEKKRLSYVFAG